MFNYNTFRSSWLDEQIKKIRQVYSKEEYPNDKLKKLLMDSYSKRSMSKGRYYNCNTKSNVKMTVEEFIDKFLAEDKILTGYCTLHIPHSERQSISFKALSKLRSLRTQFKSKMMEFEKGSPQYIYNQITQLVYKILANSYYGILGQKNSIFFNSHIQNAITLTGQDIIMSSITSMEAFLMNNTKFEDLDSALLFIKNVYNEKYMHDILKYTQPINKGDLLDYLCSRMVKPTAYQRKIFAKIIESYDQESLNKLYYKNNLYPLLMNEHFMNNIGEMIKWSFLSDVDGKTSITPEVSAILEDIKDLIIEFAYYDNLLYDKHKRSAKDNRDTVITIDTDSNFFNIMNYIDAVTSKFDVDLKDENKMSDIVNIFINIVTRSLAKTFSRLTENMKVPEEHRHFIEMKPEFVYRRILLTDNKKHYAGWLTSELGKLLNPNNPKNLDMKGLAIKKSTLAKGLREQFANILENDILKSEEIDIKRIVGKFTSMGNEILNSIKSGSTEYAVPGSVDRLSSYKGAPVQLQQVQAMLLWNALEPFNQIAPPDKINILTLNKKIKRDSPEMEKLRISHPDKYDIIIATLFTENPDDPLCLYKYGFNALALPKTVTSIPEYIRPFVDADLMKNKNLANGHVMLKSLGIHCAKVKSVNYKSNILRI